MAPTKREKMTTCKHDFSALKKVWKEWERFLRSPQKGFAIGNLIDAIHECLIANGRLPKEKK